MKRTQKDVEVVTQETVEPPLGQEVGEPHTEDHTRIKDDIRPPKEEFSVSGTCYGPSAEVSSSFVVDTPELVPELVIQ